YWPLLLGALLPTSCGGGEDLGACPTNSDTQQLTGRNLVNTRCAVCHSSLLSGAAPQDAPDDLNFDNLSTVPEEGGEMYAQAKGRDMPPAGSKALTSDEVESVRVWLACGAKDVK